MLQASRHTLTANIIQQLCAGLLLIFLPNILGKNDYAQVVFVAVLLSFMEFADAGITRVYGRVVPPLLAHNKHDDVGIWDSSVLFFGILTSSIYSIIIAIIYYHRYGNIGQTLLLMPIPLTLFCVSFYTSRCAIHRNFAQYRKAITWRSLASLTAFPLVYSLGLLGFFISNLISVFLGLTSFGQNILKPLRKTNWLLVKKHIPEGLSLSLTTALVINIMGFARLYASFNYKAEDIATYGIVSMVSMSLLALMTSIFMPVSVELHTLHGSCRTYAIEYAAKIIKNSLLPIIAITFLSIICAPTVLHICFPRYSFDRHILTSVLLGVSFYSFITIFANFMIIRKQFVLYLVLVAMSFTLCFAFAFAIDIYCPTYGAAYSQLIGIMFCTLLLFWAVSDFSDTKHRKAWQEQAKGLAILCIFTISVAGFLL